MNKAWLALVCGGLLAGASAAAAEVRLAPIFSDGAVLQRDMPVPVWGTAAPGRRIAIRFADQTRTAEADADGRWMVRLDPMKAGGPFRLIVSGDGEWTFTNLLVGEVWLCAGPSNMSLGLKTARYAAQDVPRARHPMIRLALRKGWDTDPEEAQYFAGDRWAECTPQTAALFSAVGYYFGRDLLKVLDVPVGLVCRSVGGTSTRDWLGPLDDDPDGKAALAQWRKYNDEHPEAVRDYEKRLAEWEAAAKKAEAEGRPVPRRPAPADRAPQVWGRDFGGEFKDKIAPLAPLAIRGVLWFPGEADVRWADEYRHTLPALIRTWRQAWGRADLPFLFVQAPTGGGMRPDGRPAPLPLEPPTGQAGAAMRDACLGALALPATGMAISTDIAGGVHPGNKDEYGGRLARLALAKVYGQTVPWSGPLYEAMAVEGGKVRLRFRAGTAGGLVAQGGETLQGFAIAGDDRRFVWADAKIDGETVLASSPQVPKPVAVRYAWADRPGWANLFNKDGLAAAPFRTDDWSP